MAIWKIIKKTLTDTRLFDIEFNVFAFLSSLENLAVEWLAKLSIALDNRFEQKKLNKRRSQPTQFQLKKDRDNLELCLGHD